MFNSNENLTNKKNPPVAEAIEMDEIDFDLSSLEWKCPSTI